MQTAGRVTGTVAAPTVEVYEVDLQAWAPTAGDWDVLAADERARAERFVFDADRRRFAACRIALRQLLSEASNRRAAQVRFRYGPRGKPALDDDAGADWRFSVSHSGDRALIALTRGIDIGVDLERLRPLQDLQGLARVSCSEEEQQAVAAAKDPVRALLERWTAKEACLKATGTGIAGDLRQLRLRAGMMTGPFGIGGEGRACRVYDLPIDAHVAALAVCDHEAVVTRHTCQRPSRR